MKRSLVVVLSLALALCSTAQAVARGAAEARAAWAHGVVGGNAESRFLAVTQDEQGNVYAAGWMSSGSLQFDDGAWVRGDDYLIVKYDTCGHLVWARSAEEDTYYGTYLEALAVDNAGNVYAVGARDLRDSLEPRMAAFMVKFTCDGIAEWAVTAEEFHWSELRSVAVGGDGNIYVAGYCRNAFTGFFLQAPPFHLPPSWPAEDTQGALSLVARFNPSGHALWAVSASADKTTSLFNAISIDSEENIYAAGWSSSGSGVNDFGNGVVIQREPGGDRLLLVKYNPLGVAQWARTATLGETSSSSTSVGVDQKGNVYASAVMEAAKASDFGGGIRVQTKVYSSPILVKYGSDGTPQWAIRAHADVSSPFTLNSQGIYFVASPGEEIDWKEGDQKFLSGYDFSAHRLKTPVVHGLPIYYGIRAVSRDDKGNTVFAGETGGPLDVGDRAISLPDVKGAFVVMYKE